MKQYFMQSKVYRAFKEEEQKEIEERRLATVTQDQFMLLKKDFLDLSKNYGMMQKLVRDQIAESSKLEKEARGKLVTIEKYD